MIYKCKKKNKPDGVYSNYQGYKEPEEQRLKKRFKSNLQTRNKTRFYNSKKKTTRINNKKMRCIRQT
jgi:hypothetical protein